MDSSEKAELIQKEPEAEKWIRPFITAKEYIHGIERYCLWLVGISPSEINRLKYIKQRIVACKEWRSNQPVTGDAYKLRNTPFLMRPSNKYKGGKYIVLPIHTGSGRYYVPFGFSDGTSIPGNSVSIIPNGTLYHFGILMSNVHMSFMRFASGRIKSDFRYTSDIVYNNFPWCNSTPEQKAKIEKTAQMILDARAAHPDCSLADLYDETVMPADLRKAHQANDKAVMQAYGFKTSMTESEIVAELMKMYQKLTEEKA